MKLFKPLFILSLVVLLVQGCSKDSDKPTGPKPIKKQTKIVSPSINQKFSLGEEITFQVAAKKDSTQIDSISLLYKEQVIKGDDLQVSINSDLTGVGIPRLFLNVYLKGGKKETHIPKVIVLPDAPQKYGFEVKNTFPHDPGAYTQGLYVKGGVIYESTGQNGSSTLRRVEIATGEVKKSIKLDNKYFGEGIANIGDSIFQLTWQAQEAFVYNSDFEKINTYQYDTEGWGLTTLGNSLVMSDGTEYLYFRDPGDFQQLDKKMVYDNKGKVSQLNELENIGGYIYANVYTTNRIVIIDPNSGAVVGDIDLTGIFDPKSYGGKTDYLNGIAYDPDTEKIYVTGKLWPNLYEIELLPKDNI